MNRKQLSLYIATFVLAVIVVATLTILSLFPKSAPTPKPTPAASVQIVHGVGLYASLPPQVLDKTNLSQHPDGTHIQQTITPSDQAMINRDNTVGEFIKHLPYSGKTFRLYYDIDTNSFIVSFLKSQFSQANADFDKLLKDNGIQNRNWLYNLTVKQLTY